MITTILCQAGQLSNNDLVARVKVLARREREATATLIAHLAVLDQRRLYLDEGCASTFTYCVQVLHLSEYGAYSRIEAARAARKFPVLLDMLADGSLNLTTLGLLAPDLTPENHQDLLEAARHKSKRQVQELIAQLRPQPCIPSSIRRLPTQSRQAHTLIAPPEAVAVSRPAGDATQLESDTPGCGSLLRPRSDELPLPAPERQGTGPRSRAHKSIIAPLAPERYKVQFTANADTYTKLLRAQELLRSQIPDGDVGEIVDRALTALLSNLTKRKFAATDHPRRTDVNHENPMNRGGDANRRSRRIPPEVKRTVWIRDGGQCGFVAAEGRRCTERVFLEFHHVIPYSAGGEATIENIQLRCRAHNGFEAVRVFGARMYRPLEDRIGRAKDDQQTMASPMNPSTGSGPSSLLGQSTTQGDDQNLFSSS